MGAKVTTVDLGGEWTFAASCPDDRSEKWWKDAEICTFNKKTLGPDLKYSVCELCGRSSKASPKAFREVRHC